MIIIYNVINGRFITVCWSEWQREHWCSKVLRCRRKRDGMISQFYDKVTFIKNVVIFLLSRWSSDRWKCHVEILSVRLRAQCCCSASPFSGFVPRRDAKAIYSCEAEHSNELSFPLGAHFSNGEPLIQSSDWLLRSLNSEWWINVLKTLSCYRYDRFHQIMCWCWSI